MLTVGIQFPVIYVLHRDIAFSVTEADAQLPKGRLVIYVLLVLLIGKFERTLRTHGGSDAS